MLFYFVFLKTKIIDGVFQKDLSYKTLKCNKTNKLQIIKILATCTSNIFSMAFIVKKNHFWACEL